MPFITIKDKTMSANVNFRFICEPKPSIHVVEMGRPMSNFLKWASIIQKVYGENIRFITHNAKGEFLEIENDMIRFSDDGHELTDWVPLGFYWDSFDRICREMGYVFHYNDNDLEVIVETPEGQRDITLPEIDFDVITQETVNGNGRVEYSFALYEGDTLDIAMILNIELAEIDSEDDRKFFCEMRIVNKSKL